MDYFGIDAGELEGGSQASPILEGGSARAHKKRVLSFNNSIYKVWRAMRYDVSMSKTAMAALNSMVMQIGTEIAESAAEGVQHSGSKTINERAIELALERMYGKSWRSHLSGMSGGETSGAELAGGDLEGGDLEGGDLEGGDLEGGDLEGGELEGGDLEGGELEGGELEGGKKHKKRSHAKKGHKSPAKKRKSPKKKSPKRRSPAKRRLNGGEPTGAADAPANLLASLSSSEILAGGEQATEQLAGGEDLAGGKGYKGDGMKFSVSRTEKLIRAAAKSHQRVSPTASAHLASFLHSFLRKLFLMSKGAMSADKRKRLTSSHLALGAESSPMLSKALAGAHFSRGHTVHSESHKHHRAHSPAKRAHSPAKRAHSPAKRARKH